jgi:hypothetical protein
MPSIQDVRSALERAARRAGQDVIVQQYGDAGSGRS